MEQKEMLEIIEIIKNAKSPINCEGQIKDLNDYELIFSDGTYSNEGFKIYYNKQTKSLIEKDWSAWQGSQTTYHTIDLSFITDLLVNSLDCYHFDRAVKALKIILNLK
jgi:hypothetical protein